ncbi:arsenite methyltransferase [Cyclobacterium plantarum]|uniref:Arsenite methyltransferase n=1 Tax=Cyclobacterium plantarum TaxID=2716263 RepID=A0ABX0HAC0_9BACT|nr:arsenite methyltransferase [Cyclobacterium plantarum]NHE58723.1 arsenite methyltransferase [Cyclobacterium plantarum]
MKTSEGLKKLVQKKYSEIAHQESGSCCSGAAGTEEVYHLMTDDYAKVEGYHAAADLGLGCGLPTQFAKIQKGDTVIDLGSGAGNDCFVARHETGAEGKVIGIDFTAPMIRKARANAEKLGYNNVEFRQGDIEEMPVSDNVADVIVSNCVLNLVPDKQKVIGEIYRTLKPGGHFSISDIVLVGDLPEALKTDAEMYAGCVSGAILKEDYIAHINKAGFIDIAIQKEKPITLPDSILDRYMDADQKADFKSGETGIFSITLFAKKPGIKPLKSLPNAIGDQTSTCVPGTSSGCC